MNSALSAARAAGRAAAASTPSGLGPAQIQSAYKLTGLTSGGRTVAIVDAYDDPTAESDLATYRSQYGLPACTTANGCFKQVNQSGGSELPATDAGWAEEISLDLDMVSATCPDCQILLVEANRAPSPTSAPPSTRRRDHGRQGRSATATAAATLPDATLRRALQPPGHRRHGEQRRQRLRRPVPGRLQVRHRRRRHLPAHRAPTAAAGPRPPGRGAGSGCSRYNTALSGRVDANTGCSRRADGRRLRRRRPGHRRRRLRHDRPYQGDTRAGSSSAAPAPRRRSSRRSTRWPATPRGYANAYPVQPHRARSST